MENKTAANHSRIDFLDGMRGLAILLVIGFHAYARYPDLMPFGNDFGTFPVFQYGWLGVQLFFLISGFVIFMTLEKCKGFFDFMLRRWLRLFPAMLICSVIVYLTFTFLMPGVREVSLRAMLPGLTFIEPRTWSKLLGSAQPILEGSFWSLYVEVRFYAFAGLLFFALGEVAAIAGITLMFFIAASYELLPFVVPGASLHLLEIFPSWTSAEYFGWFAAGALYYRFFQTRAMSLFIAASVLAVPAAFTTHQVSMSLSIPTVLAALLIAAFFAFSVYGEWLRPILRSRLLLFIGYISYPLYLVHENIMVQLTLKLAKVATWIPLGLLPVLPILAVICLGWLIARFAEPALSSVIKPLYLRARALLRIDRPLVDSTPGTRSPLPGAGA
ncbi:acyltransferase family protein [Herbaspirillum huttiense]|uniref:acyltransferase family protein n=1 Tax=Herbaspirillum huttiense TaxID=863372 RepID=UPI003CEBD61C